MDILLRVAGIAALLFSLACAPSARAWLVPQLKLNLRSSRVASGDPFAPRDRRWDVLASGQLIWRAGSPAAWIPTRVELMPDIWVATCLDPDCVFPAPDLGTEEHKSW